MASPHIEVVAIFDAATGAPVTGATPTFDYYRDDLGVVVAAPAITEIGGGFYKFTPTFPASPARGIVYMLNTGAGHSPDRYFRYIRPEDWNEDTITLIKQLLYNRWKINSGANTLVIYDDDGTTPLKTFNLFDLVGSPTALNATERVPTP